MSTDNDLVKNALEAAHPDYDVEVEGVGQELGYFRATLRHKDGSHAMEVKSTLSLSDMLEYMAHKVADHEMAEHPEPKKGKSKAKEPEAEPEPEPDQTEAEAEEAAALVDDGADSV